MNYSILENKEFLNFILKSIQDGISVLNKDLTIRYVNSFMNRWYKENTPLEGKKCYEVYHNRDEPCETCPALRSFKSKEIEKEVIPGLPTSKNKWYEVYSYPMIEENTGEVTGVVEFVRDITERKRIKHKLKRTKERLELAMDAGEHGFWDWNLDRDDIYFSPRCYTILGYDPGEIPIDKEVISKIKREIENTQPFKEEFKLKCKDGSWKWILIKGKNFEIDDEGTPHRMVGVYVDITQQKRDKRKLQNRKEELQALNEQLTAYSEEMAAMNQELNKSFKKINKLNKRFINMINIVSNLNENIKSDENSFLSNLLHSAMNIIPEADYGKIYIVDEDSCYKFIDAVGHDIGRLKEAKISEEMLFSSSEKDVQTSKEYSFDINKTSDNVISALKPISQAIYVNITVNDELVGRISLDIAEESNEGFSDITKQILDSFSTLGSAFFSLQRYNKLQGQFTKDLITSIIQMLEMYDRYTSGHSENVAQVASEIAEEMGLPQQKITDAYWAGMVHDIGKLLIPLDILNKEGALTNEEYELIKKHPYWGYKVLSESKSLKRIAKYVLHHHERWDGRGYPDGLRGNETPLISQILVIADAWDAMRSNRAYRNALSKEKAIAEIKENSGTQFSPKVVKAFI